VGPVAKQNNHVELQLVDMPLHKIFTTNDKAV